MMPASQVTASDLPLTLHDAATLPIDQQVTALDLVHRSFGDESQTLYGFLPLCWHGKVVIGCVGNELVCVLQMLRDWEQPSLVQLVSGVTHPKYSGRSIYSTTLAAVLNWLAGQSVTTLELRVPLDDDELMHIYIEKFGARFAGQLRDCYGPGHHRNLLVLDIASPA